jgi:hypothetical protein
MGRGKAKKSIEGPPINGAKRSHRPKRRLFDWSKYDPALARQDGVDTLADELVTYRDHLKELLKDKGKFALIKGNQVIGIYESRDDALKEAVSRFRDAPVLVKQIVAKEPVLDLGGAVL